MRFRGLRPTKWTTRVYSSVRCSHSDMARNLTLRAGTTNAVLLAALLGFAGVEALGPPESGRFIHELLEVLQRRGLSSEAAADHAAGYYEGLLNEGGRVSSMNAIVSGRLGVRKNPARPDTGIRALRLPDRYIIRRDFLYYEARPNLDLADYDDSGLRLVTNSVGLSDREYAVERAPDSRRIAVLGDSVTRGQGAPFGASYEALLEGELNRRPLAPAVQRYEVMNFAVSGYRLTQMLEMASVRAAPYRPDLYIVGLSELSISRKWG